MWTRRYEVAVAVRKVNHAFRCDESRRDSPSKHKAEKFVCERAKGEKMWRERRRLVNHDLGKCRRGKKR